MAAVADGQKNGGDSKAATPAKESQNNAVTKLASAESPAVSRSTPNSNNNTKQSINDDNDNVSSAVNSFRDESPATTTTTTQPIPKTSSSNDLVNHSTTATTTTTKDNNNSSNGANNNSSNSSSNRSNNNNEENGKNSDREGSSVSANKGSVTSGVFAAQLIAQQTKRLHKLQADVIDNKDLEPLHALRVSMRQLRTSLKQFKSAIVITDDIHDFMRHVWEATTEWYDCFGLLLCVFTQCSIPKKISRDIDVMEARFVRILFCF